MSEQTVCDICGEILRIDGFAMEINRDEKAWDGVSAGIYLHFCRKCVMAELKPALDDYLRPRNESLEVEALK